MNASDLKLIVKEKYSEIALQSKEKNETSCCGATGCCSTVDYTVFSENYDTQAGYNPEADLGLGCGIPTQFASIKAADRVLDLGSGAGNDCFVARALSAVAHPAHGWALEAPVVRTRWRAGRKHVQLRQYWNRHPGRRWRLRRRGSHYPR